MNGSTSQRSNGEPHPQPINSAREAAKTEPCSDCAQLRQELAAVTEARDRALLALAREREQLDSVRLSLQRFPPPPRQEPSASSAPPPVPADLPLRYQVVDAINNRVKRLAGPLHGPVKALAGQALAVARTLKRAL